MSKTTDRRTRRTPAEWRGIVARAATASLTQAAFCRQEGISVNSLHRWQRRLAASSFVEVAAPAAEPAPQWAVEIQFQSGTIVRLRG